MLALLLLVGCRSGCVAERPAPLPQPAPVGQERGVDPLGPVALFQRPFDGERGVSNFFDHGAGERGRALMRDGRVTWGFEDHHAYDFGMPEGTALYAMAEGEVLRAGDVGPKQCPGGERAPTSVELRILHRAPDGRAWIADYRHLSEVGVAAGQRVEGGQTVARSGNTGCSSGPHLHLEILRVLDMAARQGRPVDPYGWAGEGPDPWARASGAPSVWLWKEGEAPPIRRGARSDRRGTADAEVAPHRMVGTDPLDPVGGEWVELALRDEVAGERGLAGWSISNAAGERFVLPDLSLRAGQTLRVWSARADPGPGAVSWGRSTEAWDDLGDCVLLADPAGVTRATLAYGKGDPCPR